MNKIDLFKVRMNPYAKELVGRTLDSGFIGQGEVVDKFEQRLKEELRSDVMPLTLNSCTSALDLALHLCGVESYGYGPEFFYHGDVVERPCVISTPVTCTASNFPIILRGAKILWADVDPNTFCIDPKSVERIIKQHKNEAQPIKAIMAVDWAGRSCDYDALKQFGIPVIQDAAHCWNTYYKGDPISRHGGDYVCYSFQAIKFLTSGDGGALIVPESQYERALLLRWYGMDRRGSNSMRCLQSILEAGFKYHMNDVMASIGLSNIDLANDSVQKHRKNAAIYNEAFKDLTSISIPPPDPDCSYWLYSIKVEKGTKEEFSKYLADRGIASSPVHFRNDLYECTKEFKTKRELPGVEEFAQKQVSIPVGFWLSQEDLDHIIKTIREY